MFTEVLRYVAHCCFDLGTAVGSTARVANLHNIGCRCQTHIAADARHLEIIEADLAEALSMSNTPKIIFFD